jgi:REP element-mobilizing transposase RayT
MTVDEMHLGRPEQEDRYRFDYKGMHRYIITLSTHKSRTLFTENETILKVLNVLRETGWKYHFDVYAYCCMPDYLIMIVRGKTEYSDMKEFLAAFRAASSTLLDPQLGHPLWKRRYTERVLRKKEDSREIAQTIYRLPVKAGLAATPDEYPFQGSFVITSRNAK